MPIVAPITEGGEFARIAGFTVSLTGCGLLTSGVVRLDQLRAVDLKARGGKKIESIPKGVLDDILTRASAIFEFE